MEHSSQPAFNTAAEFERQERRSRLPAEDRQQIASLEKGQEAALSRLHDQQQTRRPEDMAAALKIVTRQHSVLRHVPAGIMAEQTRRALENKASLLVDHKHARERAEVCKPYEASIAAIERKADRPRQHERDRAPAPERAPDAGLHRAFARRAVNAERKRER
jgi:hypothetical protein